MHSRASIYTGIVAAMAAFLLACGKTPTQPGPVQKPSPSTLTAIRLTGPTALAPGATGQFSAIAERSDGSSEDVTATASWSILWTGPDRDHTGSNVLRIIGAGTVQALAQGEASVRVQIPFQGSSPATTPTLPVLVLEPGTYRISGTVTSAGLPEPAAVEIVSGTGIGLRTTSNSLDGVGRYALYGAAGNVELRVSADGFDQQIRRIVVTDNMTSDFDLGPLVTPTDLSGSWAVTVSASSSCRAMLPEIGWEREFDVSIAQQGTRLSITRTSPTFYESCTPSHRPVIENGEYSARYSHSSLLETRTATRQLPLFVRSPESHRVAWHKWIRAGNGRRAHDPRHAGHGTRRRIRLYGRSRRPPTRRSAPRSIVHATDHTMTLRRR